jgi:hypothetical protein
MSRAGESKLLGQAACRQFSNFSGVVGIFLRNGDAAGARRLAVMV